jgi:hypothetical protein
MARQCRTVPGFGKCCAASQDPNIGLGKVFKFQDSRGNWRCGECNTIQRTKNRGLGFQFRFHKNMECQLGPGGCPTLQQGPGGLQLGGGAPVPVFTNF